MSQEIYRVLVVDNDDTSRAESCAFLKGWQLYDVKAAKDANEALSMLRAEFFHLIIAEIDLPDMDGFQLMWQIHSRFKLPVVFMSTDRNVEAIIHALDEGAMRVITKPFVAEDFRYLWQLVILWQNKIQEEKGKGKADPDPNEDVGTSSSYRLI
ncbi:hypothetical protein ACET3Z_005994 [Daucus carota]